MASGSVGGESVYRLSQYRSAFSTSSAQNPGSVLGAAFQEMNLDDGQDHTDVPLSQPDQREAPAPGRFKVPRRLALDLSSQPSQDPMI